MNAKDRGGVVLDVAGVLSRLDADELASVRRALALAGGAEELAQMIVQFCQRPGEERREIIGRLRELNGMFRIISRQN